MEEKFGKFGKHNMSDAEIEEIAKNVLKEQKKTVRKVSGNTEYDSKIISAAVQQKSVIQDRENNRILALTDNAIYEVDDKLQRALTITIQNIFRKFKQAVNSGKATDISFIETLTYFECTSAAYIETAGFNRAKKELHEMLADLLKNGDEETKKMVRRGIIGFFSKSKANIFQGRRKFANLPYEVDNSQEKELLRHIYIAELIEDGVIDYSFLVEAGIVSNMDKDTIEDVYRQSEIFTPEQVENAFYLIDAFQTREEILEYYAEHDKKYLVKFATSEELVKFVIDGKVSPKDAQKRLKIDAVKQLPIDMIEQLLLVGSLSKGIEFIDFVPGKIKTERFLNRRFLNSLDRERFLRVVLSEDIKNNYQNPYTSEDYINSYGRLNSDDILTLQENGLVDNADIIKLTAFKSMKIQDEDEYNKMLENQIKFYDLERLESLLKENKLSGKFVQLFNTMLNELLTEEQRKNYIQKFNEDLNAKENVDESLVELVRKGFNFGKELNYKISEESIYDLFIEDKISEKELIDLFTKGLISEEAIGTIYSSKEIYEHYKQGKMDYRVLVFLDNKTDVIRKELESGKLSLMQLMNLYSAEKGINEEEFLKIVDGIEIGEERLVEYISDDISAEKVEILFNNYYISQNDLSELVGRNIITKKQAEEFAKKIATHEEYESIFNPNNKFIILTRETEGEPGTGGYRPNGNGDVRASQIKNDPELQELLISQIGFDERTLLLKGTNNSLDGYRVFPSENYGVMVFIKGDKPGNATYIMSLQQGLYFLNKINRENKNQPGIRIESDATKSELRQTEFVKVINASAGWGTNLVDSVKRLSPEFKEKMRGQSSYRKNVEDIVEEIRQDYIDRRDRDL